MPEISCQAEQLLLSLMGLRPLQGCSQVLGIPSDLAAATRQGLPFSVLERLRARFDLPLQDLYRAVRLPQRTGARRRAAQRLSTDESDRVARFASVATLALQALGNEKRAGQWLQRPILTLGNARPLDLLDTEAGTESVRSVLNALIYGGVA